MIMLKSRAEIERMGAACDVVAEVLSTLRERVRPGVTTGELDDVAEEITRKRGAKPAFKGYEVAGRVFPACVCISVNEEVVHGIPSKDRALVEGDIVGLDFGVSIDGYFGDSAVTLPVGTVTPEVDRLLETTRRSLVAGIEAIRPGGWVEDISAAVQDVAEGAGYGVVREFVGHGIGKRLHEEPQIPNYRTGSRGAKLSEGMVLAIEPMVNAGAPEVCLKEDGWTAVTRDGSLSAHFEHSVAVTADGPYILTLRPGEGP
jgi:methionyl aminopeptidase